MRISDWSSDVCSSDLRFATDKPADAAAMRKLYDSYSPDRLSLADRAYVSGIHPLELWLAGYLYRHPGASMREIVAASADVRQESYGWLFKSSRISAQNRRLRTLLARSEAHTFELQSLMRISHP